MQNSLKPVSAGNLPDEINVIAKLKESKDLRSKIFKVTNIKNVNKV